MLLCVILITNITNNNNNKNKQDSCIILYLERFSYHYIDDKYGNHLLNVIILDNVCLFVLRFYGPVNPMWSCQAWSVYLTTRLLGRLSPLKRLTSTVHILSPETDNCFS